MRINGELPTSRDLINSVIRARNLKLIDDPARQNRESFGFVIGSILKRRNKDFGWLIDDTHFTRESVIDLRFGCLPGNEIVKNIDFLAEKVGLRTDKLCELAVRCQRKSLLEKLTDIVTRAK